MLSAIFDESAREFFSDHTSACNFDSSEADTFDMVDDRAV